MKANYNVTGNDRKALVAAIENLTGDKAIYMRMPTCAYEIGDITVDKEGSVTCEDADKLERIIHNLIADGFTPEDTGDDENVYVIRNGEKLLYSALAKEVETSPTAGV